MELRLIILHLLRYKRYIDIEDVGHPIGNLVYCAIKTDELFEENGKNRSNGTKSSTRGVGQRTDEVLG